MVIPYATYGLKSKRLPLSLGFSRYGIWFDYNTDNVLIANHVSLNPTGAITMEIFIFITQDTVGTRIIMRKGGQYGIHLTAPRTVTPFIVGVIGGFTNGTGVAIELNRWNYIRATYDGSEIRTYLNRDFVAPAVALVDTIAVTANSLLLGGTGVAGQTIPGYLDEAKIYGERVLTEYEGQRNMLNYHSPYVGNLVFWLPMEEGSGPTAYDRSGQGNDGSLRPVADPPIWSRVEKWWLRVGAEL